MICYIEHNVLIVSIFKKLVVKESSKVRIWNVNFLGFFPAIFLNTPIVQHCHYELQIFPRDAIIMISLLIVSCRYNRHTVFQSLPISVGHLCKFLQPYLSYRRNLLPFLLQWQRVARDAQLKLSELIFPCSFISNSHKHAQNTYNQQNTHTQTHSHCV